MKKVFSSGIVPFFIKNNTIEYLLLQHTDSSCHWDFPKGKIEHGEDKQQAALRELNEEASIFVTIIPEFEYSFSYFFKNHEEAGKLMHKTVYFYTGMAQTQEVCISFEHQNYAWLDYERAREHLTYNNAKKLLDAVHTFLKNNQGILNDSNK